MLNQPAFWMVLVSWGRQQCDTREMPQGARSAVRGECSLARDYLAAPPAAASVTVVHGPHFGFDGAEAI